ncbi:MAG: DUF2207 domain-containing protein [Dehalococcoidia bacterium]
MRSGVLAAVVLALLLGTAGAASVAAQAGERIQQYDIAITIEEDGAIVVDETIRYDFGGAERRGIIRDIPVRLHYDDEHDRLYDLDVIEVAVSEGTPGQYVVEDIEGGTTRIRIGDADTTITGAHTYRIQYRVAGALNAFEGHDELYWNAIGGDWAAPIDGVSVTVQTPVAIERVACYAGPENSRLTCDAAQATGDTAQFTHGALDPYEAVSIVVALPEGAVEVGPPVLEERWSLGRAFSVTPFTVGASALLFVGAGIVLVRLVWLGGRDRRWAGSAVNRAFGAPGGHTERVGLFEDDIYPVEYAPPDGLRPGEIGVLTDEIAHPLDVTATIIDLGVRGFLRIEEIEEESGVFGWSKKSDWRLVRQPDATGDLVEYERLLLDGLFEDGDEVLLSDLKTTFVERLQRVQETMYEAVVAHRWFPRSPASIRNQWVGIGIAVLLVGLAVQVAAIVWTPYALVPLALPVAGVVLLAAHGSMPHRTARGTAALTRVRGFRRFIETAETERARFAEQANLFYEYLPYAIVFGSTKKWAQAFEGLATSPSAPGWYVSPHAFAVGSFVGAMDSFAVTSSGTIASTPGGSGSSGFSGGGFSGGGGGGGGGGSW